MLIQQVLKEIENIPKFEAWTQGPLNVWTTSTERTSLGIIDSWKFLSSSSLGPLVVLVVLYVVVRLYRSSRPNTGYCETCGYPLHDLPSSTCPECGDHIDERSQTINNVHVSR